MCEGWRSTACFSVAVSDGDGARAVCTVGLRWILTPSLLSTLHTLCLLQYWFPTPSLILRRITSTFRKPGVAVKNCLWNERRVVALWSLEIFGKCGVVLFFFLPSFIVGGQSQTTKVSFTRWNLFSELCVIRSCSLRKAYNFLFTMRPRSLRL